MEEMEEMVTEDMDVDGMEGMEDWDLAWGCFTFHLFVTGVGRDSLGRQDSNMKVVPAQYTLFLSLNIGRQNNQKEFKSDKTFENYVQITHPVDPEHFEMNPILKAFGSRQPPILRKVNPAKWGLR